MTAGVKDAIKAGDLVAYVATDGAILGNYSGKVYGVFRTLDGKTLADVQWNRFGLPKRLSVDRLVKITAAQQ